MTTEHQKFLNNHVRSFLSQYKEWADAGAPDDHAYLSSALALCDNLAQYSLYTRVGVSSLNKELGRMFQEDRLDKMYPFNTDCWDFGEDSDCENHHKNPRRMAWVKKILDEAPL